MVGGAAGTRIGNKGRSSKRSTFMNFLDINLMKGVESRLTMVKGNDPAVCKMSKENLRKLKNSYRHPFERIPAKFFKEEGLVQKPPSKISKEA
jgi:hypothetical protein